LRALNQCSTEDRKSGNLHGLLNAKKEWGYMTYGRNRMQMSIKQESENLLMYKTLGPKQLPSCSVFWMAVVKGWR
jgi:hypothetical protein